MIGYDESHRQIEDVIDASIQSGQYDMIFGARKNTANVRYAYSTPTTILDDLRGTSNI